MSAPAPELWLRLVCLRTRLGFWGQSQLQLWAGTDCDSQHTWLSSEQMGWSRGEKKLLGSLLALGRPGLGLMPAV